MTSDGYNKSAFIVRWEQVLYNIKQTYLELAKNKANANFERDICDPVAFLDNDEIDDPVEIVRQLLPPSDRSMSRDAVERIPVAPILLAAVYCYRARQAELQDNHDLGWTQLVDAGYWCGAARIGNGIGSAMQLAVAHIQGQGFSAFSHEGNKAKSKSSKLFVDEAYYMVREKKPVDMKWPTIVDAVLAIQTHMLQFAKDNGVRAAPSNIQRRLSELLSEMPDASEFFETKG